MGVTSSLEQSAYESHEKLSNYTSEEIRVLEWRANPQSGQFVPKVIFQLQKNKSSPVFGNQCCEQESAHLRVRHQQFIGNLTVLSGKLSLEESLFTIKSLLSGHEAILNYFGKTVVSANLSFVTKQGAVKAWINENYKRNKFSWEYESGQEQKENNFLRPEDWLDEKFTCSEANAIQKIVYLGIGLCQQRRKYEQFLQGLDRFITKNILKNFNFERVNQFINKFIFDKHIFVDSSLLKAIERLYYENFPKQKLERSSTDEDVRLSFNVKESKIEERQSTSYTNRDELGSKKSIKKNSCQTYQTHPTKNSEIFNLVSYTNLNQEEKLNQSTDQSCIKNSPIYGSYCPSQISGLNISDSAYLNSKLGKNHITCQYGFNFSKFAQKLPEKEKQLSSISSIIKDSSQSIKSFNKKAGNELVKETKSGLRIISEGRQIDSGERFDKKSLANRLQSSIIENQRINHIQIGPNFSKKPMFLTPQLTEPNFPQGNESICWNLTQKDSSFNPSPMPTVTLFTSNYENIEHKRSETAVAKNKTNSPSIKKICFADQLSEAAPACFTNKTITRLISSNQNVSDQQQSEGEFPSRQNSSIYSGILASMGRSAKLINLPSNQKIQMRSSKKTQTIFTPKDDPVPKAKTPKSQDPFVR